MSSSPTGAGRIFTGTAQYYARYRPCYPEEVFTVLRVKFGLDERSRVLDLGCGPGPLAIGLAPGVGQVIGVDPNEEMLAEARRLAAEKRTHNITWLSGESGLLLSMAGKIGIVRLTVMGRSLHWMDRARTLRDLYTLTDEGGGVAVIDSEEPKDTPDNRKPSWRDLIWEVSRRWLGEERRAGPDGVYSHSREEHGKLLQDSPFRDFEVVRIPIEGTRTLDEVIGYLYSTSHCSPAVLGNLKDDFEADLRRELLAIEPSGIYHERASLGIKMAWKR